MPVCSLVRTPANQFAKSGPRIKSLLIDLPLNSALQLNTTLTSSGLLGW